MGLLKANTPAGQWKKAFMRQVMKQDPINYRSKENFLNELKKRFDPIDKSGDALTKLRTRTVGKQLLEEFASDFDQWIDEANIDDEEALKDYFYAALNEDLRDKILFSETPPTTYKQLKETAIRFDNTIRQGKAIALRLKGHAVPTRYRVKTYEPRIEKDLYVMDIDSIETDE